MAINWNKIKTEYLTTDISYDEIAEKYELSETTVKQRGLREKWVEGRTQYKAEITAKIVETVGTTEAEAIRKMKEKERLEFDKLNNMIWRSASEPKTDIDGNVIKGEYQLKTDLTPLDADRVVSAKHKLQTMIYKNYGIADKHEVDLKDINITVSHEEVD